MLTDAQPGLYREVRCKPLTQADEAFLTSSTREVQPIRAIDGVLLPAAPGPLTLDASAAFAELVGRNLDP